MSLAFLVDLVGILGFVLSVVKIIYDFIRSHEHIRCELIDWRHSSAGSKLYVTLANRSSSPVSVVRVSFGKGLFVSSCSLESQPVPGSLSPRCVTPDFPVSLQPFSAAAVYLYFPHGVDTDLQPGRSVRLTVHTALRSHSVPMKVMPQQHYFDVCR